MDYLKYFDHAPTGKVPENQFQFNNDAAEIWKGVDRILFMDYVKDESGNWIPQGTNKVQFINDFLDYHFSKYKGAPEEFFFTLRALIVEALSWGSKDQAINYLYSPIIEKWIKKMENMSHRKGFEKPKIEHKSLRRVYSFILAQSYHKGNAEIKNMSKTDFLVYVSELFKDSQKANSVYQTVRSTYKTESNFLNFFSDMKDAHSLDYEYAMKVYRNYFTESGITESE